MASYSQSLCEIKQEICDLDINSQSNSSCIALTGNQLIDNTTDIINDDISMEINGKIIIHGINQLIGYITSLMHPINVKIPVGDDLYAKRQSSIGQLMIIACKTLEYFWTIFSAKHNPNDQRLMRSSANKFRNEWLIKLPENIAKMANDFTEQELNWINHLYNAIRRECSQLYDYCQRRQQTRVPRVQQNT
ncbi:uncharacterized protein LOC128957210 [Oppia nitens]|uniref:uncharacterized protein LOC128957210 n=1 Tax=Oppia nitens TaxID=1686743 RepID=UPI0023DC5C38|nr:uncharacterized protein LOC128957210 [Oppia nitens]